MAGVDLLVTDGQVGFTGTRDLSVVSQERRHLLKLYLQNLRDRGYTHLHHGDCVGADAFAGELAESMGYLIVLHPPDRDRYRAFTRGDVVHEAKPYIERDHDIVDAVNGMLALPRDPEVEERRSGTWTTVRYARQVGRPLKVV